MSLDGNKAFEVGEAVIEARSSARDNTSVALHAFARSINFAHFTKINYAIIKLNHKYHKFYLNRYQKSTLGERKCLKGAESLNIRFPGSLYLPCHVEYIPRSQKKRKSHHISFVLFPTRHIYDKISVTKTCLNLIYIFL